MCCEPAPDFVAVTAPWLDDDDGPAVVTVPFTVVPVVEFPYTPVAESVAECEDEVEVIVEFVEELAEETELEVVGSGIPLYKRAWGLATVGMAVMPAEKDAGGKDIVVVCVAVLSAVTLHAPAVPAGQSTVKVLFNCQKSTN